jgi:hypothetical protein
MLFSAHQEAPGKEIERPRQVYKQQSLKMSASARPTWTATPSVRRERTHELAFSQILIMFSSFSLIVFLYFPLFTHAFFVYVSFVLVYCAKLW